MDIYMMADIYFYLVLTSYLLFHLLSPINQTSCQTLGTALPAAIVYFIWRSMSYSTITCTLREQVTVINKTESYRTWLNRLFVNSWGGIC